MHPTARYADIVSPRFYFLLLHQLSHFQVVPGSDNSVAIELLSTHIRRQMNERARHFRKNITYRPVDECLDSGNGTHGDSTLVLLPQTPQLKVRHPQQPKLFRR